MVRSFFLIALVLSLSACATRPIGFLSHDKDFWLDEGSEYSGLRGIYFCKANDQGDMKNSHPVCFQAERKTLKEQSK